MKKQQHNIIFSRKIPDWKRFMYHSKQLFNFSVLKLRICHTHIQPKDLATIINRL